MIVANLVTPKDAAKHELLLDKPATGAYLSGALEALSNSVR